MSFFATRLKSTHYKKYRAYVNRSDHLEFEQKCPAPLFKQEDGQDQKTSLTIARQVFREQKKYRFDTESLLP